MLNSLKNIQFLTSELSEYLEKYRLNLWAKLYLLGFIKEIYTHTYILVEVIKTSD